MCLFFICWFPSLLPARAAVVGTPQLAVLDPLLRDRALHERLEAVRAHGADLGVEHPLVAGLGQPRGHADLAEQALVGDAVLGAAALDRELAVEQAGRGPEAGLRRRLRQ